MDRQGALGQQLASLAGHASGRATPSSCSAVRWQGCVGHASSGVCHDSMRLRLEAWPAGLWSATCAALPRAERPLSTCWHAMQGVLCCSSLHPSDWQPILVLTCYVGAADTGRCSLLSITRNEHVVHDQLCTKQVWAFSTNLPNNCNGTATFHVQGD